MGKSYSELLKDPRWQKKRLDIYQRDKWKCVKCSDPSNTLHVHHKVYFTNTAPWDYTDDCLETLCVKCHETEHEIISQEQEPERKYEHMLQMQNVETIDSLTKKRIAELMEQLAKGHPIEIETEIMKNIIYLQAKRKEFHNGL